MATAVSLPPITSIFERETPSTGFPPSSNRLDRRALAIPNLRVENGPAKGARPHRLAALGGEHHITASPFQSFNG